MKYQSADIFIISNQVYGSFKQFVGTYEQKGIRITITIQYTWVGRDRERKCGHTQDKVFYCADIFKIWSQGCNLDWRTGLLLVF